MAEEKKQFEATELTIEQLKNVAGGANVVGSEESDSNLIQQDVNINDRKVGVAP